MAAILFGVNDGATRWYSGTSPMVAEAVAAPNGFGQPMAGRHYESFPVDVFPSGGTEETRAKAGSTYVVSLSPTSGQYKYNDITSGSMDSDLNDMFDRLLALGVLVIFCFRHEMDIHLDLGSTNAAAPAEFAAAWVHLYNLFTARPGYAANGHNVKWCLIGTAWTAFRGGTIASFWPGDQYVDFTGIDMYGWGGLNNGGSFSLSTWLKQTFEYLLSPAIAWQQSHPQPIIVTECAVVENPNDATGSQSAKQWWINAGTYAASLGNLLAGVFCFQPPSTNSVDSEVIAYASYPNKHAGVQAFITATGGNATNYGGSRPTNPTGLSVTSSADGTTASLTWNANPAGDSVTGWNVFMATGTGALTKVNAAVLAASPETYSIPGLTPGGQYTFAVAAINAAGASGFSNKFPLQMSVPGQAGAPAIDSTSVSVSGSQVTFTATAHDTNTPPLALTYTWLVSGPGGFVTTLTGASPGAFTAPTAGLYTATLTVSNGTQSTPVNVTALVTGDLFTENYQIPLPQPGTGLDVIRALGPLLRQALTQIDNVIANVTIRDTFANLANYDPTTLPDTLYVCSDIEASFISDGTNWVYDHAPPSEGSIAFDSGESTLTRYEMGDQIQANGQVMRLQYFRARKTETINNLVIYTGQTAASGLTLAKLAAYQEDPTTGDLTLVASTANLGATWTTANSKYTEPLQAAWDKVRDTRYALAFLTVGGTAPEFQGKAGPTNSSVMAETPRLCATLSGQSDIPSTIPAASLTNTPNSVLIWATP